MKNKATTKQLNCIGALCHKLKIDKENKEMIIQAFSASQCTSSKDLTVQEALLVIQHLNTLLPEDKDKSAMIGKLLSMCHEMAVLKPTEGWVKKNAEGKKVANGHRLDEWCIKYGSLHKKMSHHSYNELVKLVSQFELYYKGLLKNF